MNFIEISNLLMEDLIIAVNWINNTLAYIFGRYVIWFFVFLALVLGYPMAIRTDEDKYLRWWILYSIILYMAFRFIGLGG